MIDSWNANDEAAWQKTLRDGKAKTAAQPTKAGTIAKVNDQVKERARNHESKNSEICSYTAKSVGTVDQQCRLPVRSDSSETTGLRDAQHIVGEAMGWCLSVWFAPFSGLLCNKIELQMVREILIALGADATDELVDNLFWCCRKKLLVLNVATYVPYAGTSFQLLEVYALGQFSIHCATQCFDLTDKKHLSASWAAIEQQIFSGDRVIKSYEEFTGKAFPQVVKAKFVRSLNAMCAVYVRAERVPGVMVGQEIAGEAMYVVVKTGKKLALDVWRKVTGTRT